MPGKLRETLPAWHPPLLLELTRMSTNGLDCLRQAVVGIVVSIWDFILKKFASIGVYSRLAFLKLRNESRGLLLREVWRRSPPQTLWKTRNTRCLVA